MKKHSNNSYKYTQLCFSSPVDGGGGEGEELGFLLLVRGAKGDGLDRGDLFSFTGLLATIGL